MRVEVGRNSRIRTAFDMASPLKNKPESTVRTKWVRDGSRHLNALPVGKKNTLPTRQSVKRKETQKAPKKQDGAGRGGHGLKLSTISACIAGLMELNKSSPRPPLPAIGPETTPDVGSDEEFTMETGDGSALEPPERDDPSNRASSTSRNEQKLRMVYQDAVCRGRTKTALQVVEELGDLYYERAKSGKDADKLPKAAAYYNYALLRNGEECGRLISKLEDTERLFLAICASGDNAGPEFSPRKDTDEVKQYIRDIRSQTQLRVNDAKIGWENLINKEEKVITWSHEESMIREMGGISKEVQNHLFALLRMIVKQCLERLGEPPCKYSLLTLGDLAFGYVTPFSKMEFAFLVSSASECCLEYFRNLSRYVHIKFLNLGETPSPHTGVRFFHDLLNSDLFSFIDDETPDGIQIDFSGFTHSPSPLGLAQHAKHRKRWELISTPKVLAQHFRPDDVSNDFDSLILAKLKMCCLIDGEEDLLKDFTNYVQEQMIQQSSEGINRRLEISFAVIRRNIEYLQDEHFSTCVGLSEPFYLLKDIELLPKLLQCTILARNFSYKTMSDTMNVKFTDSPLSNDVPFRVNLANAISYFLLLYLHIKHQGRNCTKALLITRSGKPSSTKNPEDSINDAQGLPKPMIPNLLRDILGQRSRKILIKYYSVFLPVVETLIKSIQKQTLPVLTSTNTTNNHLMIQAHIAQRLLHFEESLALIQREISSVERQTTGMTARVLHLHKKAGNVALNMMQSHRARNIFLKMMDWKTKLDFKEQGDMFFDIWCNIADTYSAEGKSDKAIAYFQDAIEFYIDMGKKSPSSTFLFRVYSSLGKNLCDLGKFHDSIIAYNMAESSVDQNCLKDINVASMLINKASALINCGDYKGVILCIRKSWALFQIAFGCNAPHPSVATAYTIMNMAQQHMGKHLTAAAYGYQAYRTNAILVGCLSNLASQVFVHDGRSVNYQVLVALRGTLRLCITNNMQQEAYELATLVFRLTKQYFMLSVRHVDLVKAHHLLALCSLGTGRNKECNEHSTAASKMLVKLKGKDRAPLLLADIYNTRADCEMGARNMEPALKMFDKALNIYWDLHGHQSNHPDILKILFNKSCMEVQQGDKELGREMIEHVINKMNHTYGKIHPTVAIAHQRVGDLCKEIGDPRAALSHYRKTLDVTTRIITDASSVQIAKLYRDLGTLCIDEKDYIGGKEYLTTALMICRNLLAECLIGSVDVATVLAHLGTIHRVNKDYEAAISVHKEVLDIVQSIYNADHNSVAHAAFDLALDYMDINLYADAMMYYEVAIERKRVVAVRDHDRLELTQWLGGIGECFELLGNHEQALKAHREAVTIRRTILGCHNVDKETLCSIGRMARVYHQQGEFRKALSLWKEALVHCQTLHGDVPHQDTMAALSAISKIYRERNEYSMAIHYQRKTHKMLELCLHDSPTNDDDEALDSSFRSLAECYKGMGEYKKAIHALKDLLDHKQKRHNSPRSIEERPWVLYSMGNIYNLMGEYEKAIPYLEESRAMADNLQPQNKDLHAKILHELGLSYEMHRRFELSRVMYKESLDIRLMIFKDITNQDVLDSYTALGRIHCIIGDFVDGISCWETCLQLQRDLYGREVALPVVANTLIQLGQAYMEDKAISKSLMYQHQALYMLQQMFGKYRSNFQVAKCLVGLATSCQEAGHTADAIHYAEEACTMYSELVPGHDVHPDVPALQSVLGDCYWKSDNISASARYYRKAAQLFLQIHGGNTGHPDVQRAMKRHTRVSALVAQEAE